LSRIALRQGDSRRAASLLDSALEDALDGGDAPDAFQQGLVDMGRGDLVAGALERRIERTPSLAARASTLGNLVEFWIRHQRRDCELGGRIRQHAETMLRALTDERSPDGAVWLALWSVLTRLEDPAAAFRRIPQIEGLIPFLQGKIATSEPGIDRARLQVLLARTLVARGAGSSDEAITLLSSALDRILACVGLDAPEFVETARGLGDALERAERRDDALRHYESILDRRPTHCETVRIIADRLEALGSGAWRIVTNSGYLSTRGRRTSPRGWSIFARRKAIPPEPPEPLCWDLPQIGRTVSSSIDSHTCIRRRGIGRPSLGCSGALWKRPRAIDRSCFGSSMRCEGPGRQRRSCACWTAQSPGRRAIRSCCVCALRPARTRATTRVQSRTF
jgi:tetratricopeptide (TPR) repeat protein